MNSFINYQKKQFWFFLTLIVIPALFIINLLLIRMGMTFTGYRTMLIFYGYENFSFMIPIFIFIICFVFVNWVIWNNTFDNIEIFKNKKIFIFILVLLALLSQFFFVGIPETNPDFIRYIQYSQIFSDKGIFYYFAQWGSGFFTHVDLPTGSLPFGVLFSLFGENRLIIQVFSISITIVTAYFIFLIGEKNFSKKCGMIASLLFLSFPFLLTQIPLMLVDLISTFYITLFAYFAYSYQNDQKLRDLVISAITFFFAAYSKILAPLFLMGILAGLLIITMLKEDTIQPYQRLTLLFSVSCVPCALYFMHLSKLFSGPILEIFNKIYFFSWDWTIICIGIIIGLSIFVISPLIVYHLKSVFLKSNLYHQPIPTSHILISGIYGGLLTLVIFDLGRSYFYLRSLPNAIGIIPTILAIACIAYIIRKKQITAIPLILWIIIPILFMPNTMYKYLQPAYPAISLVCAMTICWIENVKLQKCITVSAILMGIIIALCVFYPMCITDSQINIQKSAGYLDTAGITNQEIHIIHIPTTDRFQQNERIKMFTTLLPIWFNYYGDKQHEYSISTVQNRNQYLEIINESIEKNSQYVIIITDAPSIDDNIVLPSILNYYSIVKVYNEGYHAAYWFNTQQVIILKNNFYITSKIDLKDKGILDNKVYLQQIIFKDSALSHFEPPLSINLDFDSNSTNKFVIYDLYNALYHRSDKIYQVTPGSTNVSYTFSRHTDSIVLDLHELNKKQLNIKKISINNETELIVSQTFDK